MQQAHRVLVVDPCPDNAASIAYLLRLWGHTVQVAHDGPAALEAARTYRPDVVLMEMALPGLDGCSVARCLRQPDQSAQPLLVAVTGFGGEAYRQRCRAAGFDHYLLKPVDPEYLRGLLSADGHPPSGAEKPDARESAGRSAGEDPHSGDCCLVLLG
jgi:two-component system CheB/CheR fusion protein